MAIDIGFPHRSSNSMPDITVSSKNETKSTYTSKSQRKKLKAQFEILKSAACKEKENH